MSRVIEVLVSPTGEAKVQTRGFTGAACQQATRALETALGGRQSETLTAEYFHTAVEEAGLATRADRPT